MGGKKEYHHIVPRCYLRHFSLDKNRLFVYDKIASKSYSNSVDKLGGIDDFYKIEDKFIIAESENKLTYESHFFGNFIEKEYSVLLECIERASHEWVENRIDNEIFSIDKKKIFASLIAIQYLRLPDQRDKYIDLYRKNIEKNVKDQLLSERPNIKSEIDKIIVEHDDDYNSILHARLFGNGKIISDVTELLMNKIWIFYISIKSDFHTSDNPIFVKTHLDNFEENYYTGFEIEGSEIIFPIAKSITLSIYDENYFLEKKSMSDKFQIVPEGLKIMYNCYQYLSAKRTVFSAVDNFYIAKKLKEANDGKEQFV